MLFAQHAAPKPPEQNCLFGRPCAIVPESYFEAELNIPTLLEPSPRQDALALQGQSKTHTCAFGRRLLGGYLAELAVAWGQAPKQPEGAARGSLRKVVSG